MSKGLQIIKENNNFAEWSRQVEECRSSGLSVRAWCSEHQIAVSTFHYRQQKVWKALQKSNQFVEVTMFSDKSQDNNIAALVRIGSICAEVHNGADEATLSALFWSGSGGKSTLINCCRFLPFCPAKNQLKIIKKDTFVDSL